MTEKDFIKEIFAKIGTTNKVSVEFGTHPDHKLSVTKHLKGWTQKFYGLEGGKDVFQCFITAENINKLFEDTKVPETIDLISIDIDGMDYWVWKALKTKARAVIIEFNPKREKGVQPYFAHNHWNLKEDSYYGASKEKLLELAKEKGYEFYGESKDNLFFYENSTPKRISKDSQ